MNDFRKTLHITLAISGALLTGACSRFNEDDGWTAAEDTAVCTDQNGNRVRDEQCDQARTAYGGGYYPYRWYYLSRGYSIPPYGERVMGGSYDSGGRSYARSHESAGRISRGGFGSSSHFASS
jgi:hypothetical protein